MDDLQNVKKKKKSIWACDCKPVLAFVVNPQWQQQRQQLSITDGLLKYLGNHTINCIFGTKAVYELLAASVWRILQKCWSKQI